MERLRQERDALFDKLNRSAEEDRRLVVLEKRLSALPTAEGVKDQEAMELIRSVAAQLKDGATRRKMIRIARPIEIPRVLREAGQEEKDRLCLEYERNSEAYDAASLDFNLTVIYMVTTRSRTYY